MNLMSLDIELNQLNTPKTIEIGAVVFKSTSGEIVQTFHTYVNPGEPITEFITGLTGITDVMVAGAPSITEAYYLLKNFHKKNKCFRNPILWGSGTRNDSSTIHEESGVEERNFMGFRVIDAKTLYQSYKIMTNDTVRGGLKSSCEKLGLGWSSVYGKEHRALPDALNTAIIWHHLASKMRR